MRYSLDERIRIPREFAIFDDPRRNDPIPRDKIDETTIGLPCSIIASTRAEFPAVVVAKTRGRAGSVAFVVKNRSRLNDKPRS